MRSRAFATLLVVFLFWSCATTPPAPAPQPEPAIAADVESVPPGAAVLLQDRPLGQTPVSLKFSTLEEVWKLTALLDGQPPVETRVRWVGPNQLAVRFRFGEPTPVMKKLNLARVLILDFSAKTTFDVDRSEIKAEFAPLLEEVAKALQASFPNLRFYVCGHTDATGGYQHNLQLSLARAEAVRDFLAARGVRKENMTVFGFGPDFPEADNASAEGRALNRRTELVLPRE